jgi:predicted nuclease of predicted toxin-antitoxin system
MWVELGDPPKKRLREVTEQIRGRGKFLIDESLGDGVSRVMRDFGYNVKFVPEIGLSGRSDEDIFAFAWSERRILLTHDRDFLDDRSFPFNRNPGVVVLPGGHGHEHGLVNALREVLALLGSFRNLFPNAKIEISNDNIWNVRQFDKDQGKIRQTRLRFDRDKVWQWEDEK